jgi:hypothetical protein
VPSLRHISEVGFPQACGVPGPVGYAVHPSEEPCCCYTLAHMVGFGGGFVAGFVRHSRCKGCVRAARHCSSCLHDCCSTCSVSQPGVSCCS